MTPTPALQLDQASKYFPAPDGGSRWALRPTSLVVEVGSSVALVGRSGSGKTTLLHLAAGIEPASGGSVRVLGHELAALSDGERTLFRRRHIGLVFQFFHLIPHLSVRENVLLPAMIAGDLKQLEKRADQLLERVTLEDRAKDAVDHLSGGEMQRVAICRALLRSPSVLLADEPTGNLDDATGRVVMDLVLDMVREEDLTLVLVTHSDEVAGRAERTVQLKSGAVS
ncbi:MAG: ABC transporter ATP-binding protein [Longimicrobiales bacterium]